MIPSRTVPQGLAALMQFIPEADIETNVADMADALSDVLSGEITTAVRDTVIEDIQIIKDEYLAILDGKIIAAKKEINGALDALVEQMAAKDVELITFYRGLDVSSEQMEAYLDATTEHYADIDFEAYEGGQAIYPFIISAE